MRLTTISAEKKVLPNAQHGYHKTFKSICFETTIVIPPIAFSKNPSPESLMTHNRYFLVSCSHLKPLCSVDKKRNEFLIRIRNLKKNKKTNPLFVLRESSDHERGCLIRKTFEMSFFFKMYSAMFIIYYNILWMLPPIAINIRSKISKRPFKKTSRKCIDNES